MKKILIAILIIPYSLIVGISYLWFRTFGRVTSPLRQHWGASGRKLQKQLNEEHGTRIRYGKCNLY